MKRPVALTQMLTWAYADQRVVEITGRDLMVGERESRGRRTAADSFLPPPRGISGDGVVVVGRNAALGCVIDGSGPISGIAQPLHPDAELLHEAVLSLEWVTALALMLYGRNGNLPDLPSAPRLCAVIEWDGRRYKPKIVNRYDLQDKAMAAYCPVILHPDEAEIRAAAARWAEWRGALFRLWEVSRSIIFRAHELTGIDPS